MTTINSTLRTRLLNPLEYFKISGEIMNKYLVKFLILNFSLAAPIYLPNYIFPDSSFVPSLGNLLNRAIAISHSFIFISLVSVFSVVLCQFTVINFTERAFKRTNTKMIASLFDVLPKIFTGFFPFAILAIFLIFEFLFLIIPWIWLSVLFFFFPFTIALRQSGFKSLAYSHDLVEGRWWKTFLYILVMLAIMASITLLFNGLENLISTSGIYIFAHIIELLTNTYFTITLTIMFLNFDYTCPKHSRDLNA